MPDPLPTGPVLLVGAGRMGEALLKGWLEGAERMALEISVVEPTPSSLLQQLSGAGRITLNPSLEALVPALVVLAVKPQIMDAACAPLRPLAVAGVPFLSIAAGRSMASIERTLAGGEASIPIPMIRAMPNTPTAIGRGVSVCVAGAGVSPEIRALATRLLEAGGAVEWIDDERLIDAVTAVSGSGPAYVFHMAECMAKAGEDVGLPRDLAVTLARLTVAGAGDLLRAGPEDAAALRAAVTSPGGTTAAALDVLMGPDGLAPLLKRAIRAARDRGRALDG